MAGGLPQIGLQAVLDDANFRNGFSNYTRSIDQMIAKTGIASYTLGGQFTHLGAQVLSFGALAAKAAAVGTLALTGAVIGLGVASVKTASDYETAFAGVLKTTDGLGNTMRSLTPEGEKMLESFRALTREVPVTFEELAHIGELGGQLGIANDQLIDFSKTIAQIGVSTNLTSEQAATDFAQIINIMGISQDQVKNMGAAIVGLGNNFATTERDIDNFALRIAGAGKIAGLTTADIFGIGTAFSSVGVEAEAGGTAVQKMLIGMNTAVAEGNDKLAVFAQTAGMSADEFKSAWEKDAGQAFVSFVEGLGKAGDDATNILAELGMSDQRLIRGFLGVANAGDLMRRAVELSNEEYKKGTALQEEAGKRFATTASQIQILKNNFRDMGFTIGNALLPPLNNFLGMVITKVMPALQDFANYIAAVVEDGDFMNDWLTHLPGFLQPVAEGIGRVIAAFQQLLAGNFSGALAALGVPPDVVSGIMNFAKVVGDFVTNTLIPFISTHLPELKAAFLAIGAVLASAAIVSGILAIVAAINPLTIALYALIGLVGLIAAAWAGNWFNIQGVVGQVVTFVTGLVGGFVAALTGFWQQNGAAIQNFFITAWQKIQQIVGAVVTALAPMIQGFMAGLQTAFTAFQPVIENFGKLWQALGPLIQVVAQIIGAVLLGLLGVIVGVIGGVINALNPLIATIGNVVAFVIQIVTGVVQFLTGALNLIVGLFTNNSQQVQNAWTLMGTGIQNIISGLVNGVVALIGGLVQTVVALVSGFVTTIVAFFQNLYNVLVGHSIIPDLVNAAITLFTTLSTVVTAVIQAFAAAVIAIIQALATAVIAVLTALSATWQTIWNTIATVTQTVFNTMKAFIQVTLAAIQAVVGAVLAAIMVLWTTIWGQISTTLQTVWNTMKDNVTSAINTMKSIIIDGINAAKSVWDSVWGGFVGTVAGAASAIIGKLEGLLSSVRSIVGNILSEAAKAGGAMVAGLTGSSGTSSNKPAQSAAKQAGGVVSSWKKAMGIESPSRVMADIGKNMNLGLIRGMTRTGSFVQNAVRSMVNRTVAEARAGGRVVIPNGGIAAGNVGTTTINNTTQLTINPTYENYQSPASVYYDATAALSAARL